MRKEGGETNGRPALGRAAGSGGRAKQRVEGWTMRDEMGVEIMKKVRAFEVDPAPLKNSREISKARGVSQARAFEKRSARLNGSQRRFRRVRAGSGGLAGIGECGNLR